MPKKKIFKSGGRPRVPHRNKTVYTFEDEQKRQIASSIMMMRLDGALLAIEERHEQLHKIHAGNHYWYVPFDTVMNDLYNEADRVMRLMIRSGYLHHRYDDEARVAAPDQDRGEAEGEGGDPSRVPCDPVRGDGAQ